MICFLPVQLNIDYLVIAINIYSGLHMHWGLCYVFYFTAFKSHNNPMSYAFVLNEKKKLTAVTREPHNFSPFIKNLLFHS